MGFCKISRDVKLAVIRLHERDLLSLRNILDSCGFSERTWFRILKLWRETGDVVNNRPTLRGRLRALDHEDIDSPCNKSIHICTFHNNLSRARPC
ncbi:hypothetical protein BDR07DRAFT_1418164 [Suillus spraguei]|nr:hypothetical protein BDR07DRAFT_1418164 [Suillus spraguei]